MQRLLDCFIDDALEIAPAPLHLVDQVGWDVQRFADVIQQRLPSLLKRSPVNQARRAALFFGQNYLRQRDLSQVLAGLPVDHLDLMSIAHKSRNALERDVGARSRVIELAIRVFLDNVSLGGSH